MTFPFTTDDGQPITYEIYRDPENQSGLRPTPACAERLAWFVNDALPELERAVHMGLADRRQLEAARLDNPRRIQELSRVEMSCASTFDFLSPRDVRGIHGSMAMGAAAVRQCGRYSPQSATSDGIGVCSMKRRPGTVGTSAGWEQKTPTTFTSGNHGFLRSFVNTSRLCILWRIGQMKNVPYESQNFLALRGASTLRQQLEQNPPQTRPSEQWQQIERTKAK